MLPPPAEKLQNFFGVFLQFQIGVDKCLKAERDELNQKLDWPLEQAHLSRKKLCGAFSERLGEELMNRLRRMFDETEAWLSKRRDKRTKAAAHTRRSLNTPTQTER